MGKFLYQWGGSIVMVAAFLIGIPDSFSASREFVAWASPLGMQPIHLAFWLLGIGAIYTTIVQGLRIKRFELSSPNVEYETVDSLPFQEAYYVRLVFRNNVVYPSGHISTSQSTKARITIFQTNGLSLDSWDGRWAENDWPTSYGDITEKNKRDIIAGDPAILDIGARIDGQVQFKGHYNRRPESPEPPRKLLNPDSYYVLVEIWAANMGARESWFTLQIPNIPQSNDAEQVKITPTMKPVFGKVDSQS
jgi:hypothetical protein